MKRMKLWNEITRLVNICNEIKVQQLISDKVYPPNTFPKPVRNHMQKDGMIRKFDLDMLKNTVSELEDLVIKHKGRYLLK